MKIEEGFVFFSSGNPEVVEKYMYIVHTKLQAILGAMNASVSLKKMQIYNIYKCTRDLNSTWALAMELDILKFHYIDPLKNLSFSIFNISQKGHILLHSSVKFMFSIHVLAYLYSL